MQSSPLSFITGSTKKTKLLVVLTAIFLFYILIALNLLTKDPTVFPDESSFSNTAYRLTNENVFGKQPFEKQLTLIEDTTFTQYGPMYYLVLSVPLKLFGYSIHTVRATSVVIGLLVLVVLYFLIKEITSSEIVGLLSVFLLSIDINFLRMARFGRMDILVAFFILLAYLFYLKTYNHPSAKRYLILGALLTLPVLTHFFNGVLPLIVIFFHLLVTKKLKPLKNKQFLLFLVPLSALIIWFILVFFFAPPSAINESKLFILKSLIPNFHQIKIVIGDKLTFNQINFIIYFGALSLLAWLSPKGNMGRFWLLNGVIGTAWTIWGNSFFYLGYIPIYLLPILPLSFYLTKEKPRLRSLQVVIIFFFIGFSMVQQMILTQYLSDFSYQKFGRRVSTCLQKPMAKVYLDQLIPDPYFYLVKQRADLKLAYQKWHDRKQSYLKNTLPMADYVVTYDSYRKITSLPAYQQYQNQSGSAKFGQERAMTKAITGLGLKPDMADFLYKKTRKTCVVPGDGHQPAITIFSLNK